MLDQAQLRKHIEGLNSGREASQTLAMTALKEIPEAEWESVPIDIIRRLVDALRRQLPKGQEGKQKPPRLRQESVTILGNLGPRSEPVLPQFIELLEEGVPESIREAAAAALGKLGKAARPAVDQLIHVLHSNCRISLANRVARALGDIGCADERVKTALVNFWLFPVHSSSNQVQVAIALCKLRIDARGLLKSLAATLVSNRDTSLRKSAAEALAWCSREDIDVVPALTAALYDDDEEVARLAEAGLTQMRLSREKAVYRCAMQLKDSVHAEAALRKSGVLAVPALMEALSAKDPLAREKAARTLGAIGEVAVEAVPALKAVLEDKHLEVRLSAAKGLWNVSKNADAVVPVLSDLLTGKRLPETAEAVNGDDARRTFLQSVIEALCRIGPPAQAAIPALTRKAKDENRLIRESAQRAIRVIAPALVR
ncbi:MAG: HEAT repeat domain-containing protein [Gemmataceae bacterium]|nr:HEAT repeat domain-containing protein [Gemmataceae bacterium]